MNVLKQGLISLRPDRKESILASKLPRVFALAFGQSKRLGVGSSPSHVPDNDAGQPRQNAHERDSLLRRHSPLRSTTRG